MVYAIDPKVLTAVVASKTACRKAYATAKARVEAERHGDKELIKTIKARDADNAPEKDKRTIRKKWPTDPDDRHDMITEYLMISLMENEGNVIEVAACLSLEIHEITEFLYADQDLMEQKDRGLLASVLRSEAMLLAKAAEGNIPAVKMLLINRDPENWSEKSTVTVKSEGFSPPDAVQHGSVLDLVKGVNQSSTEP